MRSHMAAVRKLTLESATRRAARAAATMAVRVVVRVSRQIGVNPRTQQAKVKARAGSGSMCGMCTTTMKKRRTAALR